MLTLIALLDFDIDSDYNHKLKVMGIFLITMIASFTQNVMEA